jgi:hypothetical protein
VLYGCEPPHQRAAAAAWSLHVTSPASALRLIAIPCLALAAGTGGAEAEAAKVVLVPHRAVYDLSLLSSRGLNAVDQATGRLVFEITGNACEGYTTRFRQVTQLSGSENGGDRSFDVRSTSYETGDGSSMRFTNDTVRGGGKVDHTEGRAQATDTGVKITLREPKRATATGPAGTLFPNIQIRRVIEEARAGDKLFSSRIYDGSDTGLKVYDTLAVIGAAVPRDAPAEPAASAAELKGHQSWPVTMSYFEPGGVGEVQPSYVMSFVLYDNGVSRALKLNYGDFTLKGELKAITFLKTNPCDK